MHNKTDIAIAQETKPLPIKDIAQKLGLSEDEWVPYGHDKAKLLPGVLANRTNSKGKLILVSAITPTPKGEGKTTVSVGLGDGLNKLGHKAVIALREPSLGPVFGIKGGAAGGGYAQVIPMEDLNLHFTGDIHAVTAANNLLAALLDNHLQQGNALGIDPRRILWRRCLDVNDRALRQTIVGLGGKLNGIPRENIFDITAASEVMAVLCLARDGADLTERLSRMVVAYAYDGQMITAGDLKAQGAMTVLLRDAMHPNLVQTLEHTPVLVHGGPFANIAHGCNSVTATRMALALGDYVVTEAGFGADLGAEKFLDIKCRQSGLRPSACVLVVTVRALLHHGAYREDAAGEDVTDALSVGAANLWGHVKNLRENFGLPVVVAINRFTHDTPMQIDWLRSECARMRVPVAVADGWEKGGEGMTDLAQAVVKACEMPSDFQFTYDDDMTLKEKITAITTKIYGGKHVAFTGNADKELSTLQAKGFGHLPVCMAKTQYSFSDNPKLLGWPKDFELTVTGCKLSAGAGFVVAYCGDVMTMPGLPKVPAAEGISMDAQGAVSGLF